jgi:hypothetical protein
MRTLAQFVGVLLVVGFIGAYFWWIIAAAAVAGLAWLAVRWYRGARALAADLAAHNAELAARADQHHAWVLQGDERGVYGPHGAQLMHYIRSDDHPTRDSSSVS